MMTLDWVVLAAYGLVLVGTGYWYSRKAAMDTEDFFLGGRRMPVWAVAISVVATSLSAATFIGVPQQAYAGNMTYLATNIGMLIAALLVAWLVIPKLYKSGAATPYSLLEKRMGHGARRAAAAAFLLGRVMASGARVYIIGIPVALVIFGEPALTDANPTGLLPAGQVIMAIAVMTMVGVVYTLAGGVRSVIWTDVIQMAVFMTAIASAIFLLMDRIPGGISTTYQTLANAQAPDGTSKLTIFDTSLSLSANYTLLASSTAFVLMGFASYGLDQDMTQRMLTCRSATRGALSVILANLAAVPVISTFMIVGLLLYIFYQRPDIMGDAAPAYAQYDSSRVFLSFVLRELPPGLSGLMIAGLFAAGLSSLNSGLNAMSSTVVNDFYREIIPDRTERHYLLVGRIGVVTWGLILGSFASICVYWQRSDGQTLIDFALGVMTFAYAGLLGVFATVLFTRRGSSSSAIAALLTGFLVIFFLNEAALGILIDTQAIRHNAEAGGYWAQHATFAWSLGFAWKLSIGAVISTLVCLVGRHKPHASHEARATQPC
jgi:solute:Na+ symporter, SSS family